LFDRPKPAVGCGANRKRRRRYAKGKVSVRVSTNFVFVLPYMLNYSTCFGRTSHPSSGVHKTVVAASGTDHTIWGASFLKRDQIRTGLGPSDGPKPVLIWSRLRKLTAHLVRPVPDAATTVLCTADDGCDGSPKHVE